MSNVITMTPTSAIPSSAALARCAAAFGPQVAGVETARPRVFAVDHRTLSTALNAAPSNYMAAKQGAPPRGKPR